MQEFDFVGLIPWLFLLLPILVTGFVIAGTAIMAIAWGYTHWRQRGQGK